MKKSKRWHSHFKYTYRTIRDNCRVICRDVISMFLSRCSRFFNPLVFPTRLPCPPDIGLFSATAEVTGTGANKGDQVRIIYFRSRAFALFMDMCFQVYDLRFVDWDLAGCIYGNFVIRA